MAILDQLPLPLPRSRLYLVNVKAKNGIYEGVVYKECQVFRGIYYGQAKRFMAPKPVFNKQMVDRPYSCPQNGNPWLIGDEDCLNLNVYAPITPGPHPVLVYIHGGSFVRGSNRDVATQGQRVATNLDVVVVTINYRLGVFGFLDFSAYDERFCTQPAAADILLALTFIKENIAAFDGDVNNITVMGESAGGTLTAMVGAIVDDDRVHKLILASPVPTAFISKEASLKRSQEFLEAQHYTVAHQLLTMEAQELVDAGDRFSHETGLGVETFSPTVDGVYVKEAPIKKQHDGTIVKRPTWIGVTADEMSILSYTFIAERWGISSFLPRQLKSESDAFASELYELYKEIYGDEYETHLYSDMIVRMPTVWYAAEVAKHQDTWLYNFGYSSLFFNRTGLKAFHSLDLYFFFDTVLLPFRLPATMAMVDEVQGDLRRFLYEGTLPWQQAKPHLPMAKHYLQPPEIDHLIAPATIDIWKQSNHYERRLNPGFEANNDENQGV